MERRKRFLSLKNACDSVFMCSDSESEPKVICRIRMRTFWCVATILIFLTCVLKLKTFPIISLEKMMLQS